MSVVTVRSVEEWAQACSRAFVPLTVHGGASRFGASLEQTALASGVSITRVASAGSVVARRSGLIAREPREDLLLSVHRSGRGSVEQRGRVAEMRAGAAVAYDASTPYVLRFPGRMSELVLQVPRGAVGRMGNAFADLTATPLPPSGSLTALSNLMAAVGSAEGAPRSAAEEALLSEAALTLLRGALLPTGRPATARIERDALERAMRTFVDEHLTDPDLSVERIATEYHVSVRTVHTVFSAAGEPPATLVRRKRLARARALLEAGEPVGRAAHRSGFTDLDTFTRAFRRHYGCTPSEVRP